MIPVLIEQCSKAVNSIARLNSSMGTLVIPPFIQPLNKPDDSLKLIPLRSESVPPIRQIRYSTRDASAC